MNKVMIGFIVTLIMFCSYAIAAENGTKNTQQNSTQYNNTGTTQNSTQYNYVGAAQNNYKKSVETYQKNPTPQNQQIMQQREQIKEIREKQFNK